MRCWSCLKPLAKGERVHTDWVLTGWGDGLWAKGHYHRRYFCHNCYRLLLLRRFASWLGIVLLVTMGLVPYVLGLELGSAVGLGLYVMLLVIVLAWAWR